MNASFLLDLCLRNGIDFFTGVPDSQLKGLCDELYARYGTSGTHHLVAHNEGGAIGLCAGHYLATGRPALCYMQNSGLGNAVNPLASLMDTKVYGLPCLLIIGWRGEPGVHDEPQHVKQGKVTLQLLETMGIDYQVLSKDESEAEKQIEVAVSKMKDTGEVYALVIEKGTFDTYSLQNNICHDFPLSREQAIQTVAAALNPKDVIVSTTGMISRELFEYRTLKGQKHNRDFLTVGSMGHASQIALGIALERADRRLPDAHGRHGYCRQQEAFELCTRHIQ